MSTKPSRRRHWATRLGLGTAACVACCAGPILAAFGVGAGGLAVVGAVTETLSLVLIGLAGVAGVVIYRRARRARAEAVRCSDSCAIDGACGCGSGARHSGSDASEPLSCALEAQAFPQRLADFRALHARSLVRRHQEEGRFTWVLRADEGTEASARALAAKELGCCSFFRFHIVSNGREVRWEATAPPPGRSMLDLLYSTSDGLLNVETIQPSAEGAIEARAT